MASSRMWLGLGLLLAAPAASATVLHVASVNGRAAAQRGGEHIVLATGYELVEQDAVRVEPDAQLDLQLGRHGMLELGPDAALEVERVPFASWSDDLRTRLRLTRGYLRVLWKRPPKAALWPLAIDVGDFTLSLTSGEFLLQAGGEAPVLCVGDGDAAIDWHGAGARASRSISGPGCATLLAGDARVIATIAVRLDDLVAPRQKRVLALAPLEVPAPVTARAEPEPAPPAPPAARPLPVSAAPVAPAPVAPAITPPPVETAPGRWIVTLASFPDQPSADAQAARLRVAGYTAEVAEAQVKGKTWYRVQLRGFPTSDLAKQTAAELAERQGFKDAWISRQ